MTETAATVAQAEKPGVLETSFFVHGVPVPKGSTKAFIPKGWKRAIITNANSKTKSWELAVREKATEIGVPMTSAGRVVVCCEFLFPRSKSHFGTKGNLLPSAPRHMTKKPDLDKLERAVWDALKGVAYSDDAQVTWGKKGKRFCRDGETPGVQVVVISYPGEEP